MAFSEERRDKQQSALLTLPFFISPPTQDLLPGARFNSSLGANTKCLMCTLAHNYFGRFKKASPIQHLK